MCYTIVINIDDEAEISEVSVKSVNEDNFTSNRIIDAGWNIFSSKPWETSSFKEPISEGI
jgi:hypothetical protein